MKSLLAPLRWLAWFLFANFVLRIWMWWYEKPSGVFADTAEVSQAMVIGLINDSMLFLALFGLLIITALIKPIVARLFLAISILLWILFVIVDVFFWIDFDGRADRLVFHYLAYPVEVLVFLEDQFALSLLILPLLFVVYLIHRQFLPGLKGLQQSIESTTGVWATAAVCLVGGLVQWQLQPMMPWPSRHLNDLGSNGMQKVLYASLIDETQWEGVYAKPSPADRASVTRPGPAANTPSGISSSAKHVLLIIEESLAGPNWWNLQRRAQYMPHFDRWRKKGIYLNHVMATGTRTTRGVEAILHGLPPLPGIALNQRDGYEKLSSLPRELQNAGFETSFVYGGWPGFSNFKPYWSNIGFNTVYTRDDFSNKWFETSWGVADEILFERVLAEMDEKTQTHERVFVSTLTVSNHRPYDFPKGRIQYPADERKQEYAVAYADWALGQFLDMAEQKPWFKDTLIVITPDHGPNPEGDSLIPIDSYRLPAIMLVPGHSPSERRGVGSLMDVPMTIVRTLGLPNTESFIGRNLLAENVSGVAPVEHDYLMGLYDGHSLTVLRRNERLAAWQRGSHGELEPAEPQQEMSQAALSLFRYTHERYVQPDAAMQPDSQLSAVLPIYSLQYLLSPSATRTQH
ncbi:MAG: sulfatase-like hydrolase/transferase [Pseudomonadota bacterium]